MHPRAYRLKFPREEAPPPVVRVRPAAPPPTGPGSGDQAALALESRELWVAAHVPDLALCALRPSARGAPLVVVDAQDHNQRLLAADARALEAGVRIGMTLGAALAAAPGIEPVSRDAAREIELLQQLAAVSAGFTPLVSLEPPDAVLLEIKPSLALFGGLRALCRKLRAVCEETPSLVRAGVRPHFTLAPTALAALCTARAGARCFITDPAVLPARLKPLPVTVLRWPEEDIQRLAAMGVRTLGELMRLPRAGFARRFGPDRLADLDRLLGRRAAPRARLTRRERYVGRLDLDHEVEDHERILQALGPLVGELECFLRARQRGITALQCRFHHTRAAPTACVLRLAAPEAEGARLLALLRERLATLALPEPVRRCELRSGALTARPLASQALWSPGERGHVSAGEMPALVEHLRARLGGQAVYGVGCVSEHRPEKAWRIAEPVLVAAVENPPPAAGHVRRPAWLLNDPQELALRAGRPQHRGPLELLAGPERIESGWWDDDVERDYYLARDARGAWLWIYRECSGARRWFLHGLFG